VVFQHGDQEMCVHRVYGERRKSMKLALFSATMIST
jgi:hypothetical protein